MSRKLIILAAATALGMFADAVTWAAAEASPTTAAPAAGAQPPAPETIQEVAVTAHRIELEKRVATFVYDVAGLQNSEGMPRWRQPVCPLVGGLSADDGEFVLGRISDIARAASVALADEYCRPNLFIIVNPDPKKLLSGMTLQTRATLFAGAHPSVIDQFVRAPRPARVWYQMEIRTPEGTLLGGANRTAIGEDAYPHVEARASFVKRSVIWTFAKVLVVVDRARLQGVSRGQLADYVAMVGLAQIKPGAPLGDAPTILKLFDGAPQAAPAGRSEWDMAFLKSLYATDQTSRGQRSQIVQQIVREIAP
jgi:hypothetical protein